MASKINTVAMADLNKWVDTVSRIFCIPAPEATKLYAKLLGYPSGAELIRDIEYCERSSHLGGIYPVPVPFGHSQPELIKIFNEIAPSTPLRLKGQFFIHFLPWICRCPLSAERDMQRFLLRIQEINLEGCEGKRSRLAHS